jgi:AcrR family transcriptional regulator
VAGSTTVPDEAPRQREGNAGGRATRDLLIRTAERLFSERGPSGVSLREVGLTAGQRNNGVMQYHFGDREGLEKAIFAYRAEAIDRRRRELLDALDGEGRGDDPRALVDALVRPLAEAAAEPDNHYVGFVARLYGDDMRALSPLADLGERNDGYQTVRRRLVPQIEGEVAAIAQFNLVTLWIIQALASWPSLSAQAGVPFDTFVEGLVDMATAALLVADGAPVAPPKN